MINNNWCIGATFSFKHARYSDTDFFGSDMCFEVSVIRTEIASKTLDFCEFAEDFNLVVVQTG